MPKYQQTSNMPLKGPPPFQNCTLTNSLEYRNSTCKCFVQWDQFSPSFQNCQKTELRDPWITHSLFSLSWSLNTKVGGGEFEPYCQARTWALWVLHTITRRYLYCECFCLCSTMCSWSTGSQLGPLTWDLSEAPIREPRLNCCLYILVHCRWGCVLCSSQTQLTTAKRNSCV